MKFFDIFLLLGNLNLTTFGQEFPVQCTIYRYPLNTGLCIFQICDSVVTWNEAAGADFGPAQFVVLLLVGGKELFEGGLFAVIALFLVLLPLFALLRLSFNLGMFHIWAVNCMKSTELSFHVFWFGLDLMSLFFRVFWKTYAI